ncbi:MAG: phosphoribosyl-ATP diphosphatase [Pseudomonadota bacterium]
MSVLAELYATIVARKGEDADASYTASLLGKGPAKCAEKFGEEAVETIIAAAQADRGNLTYEAADTVYHLMVVLASLDVDWADVEAELARRSGTSGHEEKASR